MQVLFGRLVLVLLCGAFLGALVFNCSAAEAGYWKIDSSPTFWMGTRDQPGQIWRYGDVTYKIVNYGPGYALVHVENPKYGPTYTYRQSWSVPDAVNAGEVVSVNCNTDIKEVLFHGSNNGPFEIYGVRIGMVENPNISFCSTGMLPSIAGRQASNYNTAGRAPGPPSGGSGVFNIRVHFVIASMGDFYATYRYVWTDANYNQATPSPSGITTEPNTDRYGSDYKCLRSIETPAACRSICSSESECRAYTWVKPGAIEPTAICCLKNSVPPPSRNDSCVSGVK